jgi:hypothetical protein
MAINLDSDLLPVANDALEDLSQMLSELIERYSLAGQFGSFGFRTKSVSRLPSVTRMLERAGWPVLAVVMEAQFG